MTLIAYAPTGVRILGVVCRARLIARVVSFETPDASSEDNLNYEGYTVVDWDSQQPARRDGQLVYEAEDGVEWLASDLTFKEEGE